MSPAPPVQFTISDIERCCPQVLDSEDIRLLKSFVSCCRAVVQQLTVDCSQGVGPYNENIKEAEDELDRLTKAINEARGEVLSPGLEYSLIQFKRRC